MKFMKNWKRFWTLSRSSDGFTLVELIVVIAILAILAGVAVPAYSGYIAKANEAADLQLLDALNNAFFSACIEKNVSYDEVEEAGTIVELNDDGTFKQFVNLPLSATATLSATTPTTEDPFTTTFKFYFGENINTPFEVYTKLIFVNGAFVDESKVEAGGVYSQIFDALGDKITASVNKVTGSTFGEIGAAGLMDKVDVVTGLAAELAGMNSTVATALGMNLTTLAEDLGYDLTDTEDQKEFDALMKNMISEKAAQLNPEDPTAAMNQARNEILANYAVLQTAQTQGASGKTTDQLLTELQAGISADDIKGLLKSENVNTTQEGITKAAMMYAMYTAYANQMPETTEEEKTAKENALAATGNAMDFAANMSDPGFVSYLNGETGNAAADLEGYLGALDIINQSTAGNKDAVSDLLVNGYTDPDLVAALQGLMGK